MPHGPGVLDARVLRFRAKLRVGAGAVSAQGWSTATGHQCGVGISVIKEMYGVHEETSIRWKTL